jgi:hypothetical protein
MVRVRFSKRNRVYPVVLLLIFLMAGAFTGSVPVQNLIGFLDSLPVVCPLRKMTGFLCSFCGMTHAWMYFWHGDWVRAWSANALSIPLFIGAPILAGTELIDRFWTEKRVRSAGLAGVIVLFAYTVSRNL